jgi:DNA-binding NarL/FixJ family response regulator
MTSKCAVLVVGPDPLVLQGVRRVLEGTPDFYVTAQSGTVRDAFEDMARLLPDLMLVDLRRADWVGGPELCRRIGLLLPTVDVVIRAEPADVAVVRACLRAGVGGVLSSGSAELDLVWTLRRVRSGEVVVGDDVARALADAEQTVAEEGRHIYERLRPREYEVLRLVAQGLGTKDIADELGLSRNTVRSYAQAVMSKLQVHNRVQLVVTARTLRLL